MGTHWIADVHGRHALVEGENARELWTRIRGWRDAEEPGPADQVYVSHPDVSTAACLPYEALTVGWGEGQIGWSPGPPPEPADVTKDPVSDAAPIVAVKAKQKPKPAADGVKIEE